VGIHGAPNIDGQAIQTMNPAKKNSRAISKIQNSICLSELLVETSNKNEAGTRAQPFWRLVKLTANDLLSKLHLLIYLGIVYGPSVCITVANQGATIWGAPMEILFVTVYAVIPEAKRCLNAVE
jgi:hypothetical protein